MPERYSNMSPLAALGFLANAMESGQGGDGDRGSTFPRSDAEDLSRGARFIPGEVTVARREGKKVEFHSNCTPNCWFWLMPDGSRIFHYDSMTYRAIGRENKRTPKDDGSFDGGPGNCPRCGNPHTSGGTVKAGQ
jgi:hypothetical protein